MNPSIFQECGEVITCGFLWTGTNRRRRRRQGKVKYVRPDAVLNEVMVAEFSRLGKNGRPETLWQTVNLRSENTN